MCSIPPISLFNDQCALLSVPADAFILVIKNLNYKEITALRKLSRKVKTLIDQNIKIIYIPEVISQIINFQNSLKQVAAISEAIALSDEIKKSSLAPQSRLKKTMSRVSGVMPLFASGLRKSESKLDQLEQLKIKFQLGNDLERDLVIAKVRNIEAKAGAPEKKSLEVIMTLFGGEEGYMALPLIEDREKPNETVTRFVSENRHGFKIRFKEKDGFVVNQAFYEEGNLGFWITDHGPIQVEKKRMLIGATVYMPNGCVHSGVNLEFLMKIFDALRTGRCGDALIR